MAKTNKRTQRIIGMVLGCLEATVANFEEIYRANVNDREWSGDLENDRDYTAAMAIVMNLLGREIEKNNERIIGYEAEDLDSWQINTN